MPPRLPSARPSRLPFLLIGAALVATSAFAQEADPAAGGPNTQALRDRRGNAREDLRQAEALRDFVDASAGEATVTVDELGRVHGQTVVDFENGLYVLNDAMMQGITAHETLVFSVPESWKLKEDPTIRIEFEHSSALAPHRSSLTLRVNGSAISSVKLDGANTTGGVIEAKVPRHILKDFNELKLSVVQHIDDECEDPFDPALWTRVSNQSTLTFTYYQDTITGDLGEFPMPLYDKLGYGPVHVSLAGSTDYSAAQLAAVGDLALTLGRQAAYRGVYWDDPVANPENATGHVLVVGTPAENPLVSRLVPQVPRAGEGLVAIVPKPGDPTYAAIVVTGGDAAGLAKAAEALSSDNRAQILSGRSSVIESVQPAPPPATRQQPLPVPKESSFTVMDLGIGDTTVRGYYSPPIQVPLNLEGDAKVQVDGARIGIDYAYSAYLDTRLSTMEVRLNGVTLRSVGLDDVDGDERERLWVDLPFDLMEPANQVEIIFHLFPRDFGPCVFITDKHIWGTVFASTKVEVARDNYALLPDLELLRHDLWPYGEALGTEGVTVVVANDPGIWDATAAAQIASELGRRSVAVNPKLAIVPASSGIQGRSGASQLVVLAGRGPNALFDDLAKAKKASLPGDIERQFQGDGDTQMSAAVTAPYGTIQQSVFDGTARTVLILHAPSDQALPTLARVLQDESKLRALGRSLAVIAQPTPDSAESLRTVDAAKKQQVGTIPLRSQLQTLMRSAWWMLGFAVLLGAFLLALVVRAWASRRGGQA